jgi:3-hydroxyacyl-[acyl-carrier-protein] dehydratase
MNPEDDRLAAALHTLPHGPEFRFVDRLISLTPGREGVGEYRVRGDEPFLRGHFPGEPLFPGVLLAEAAAQLAGIVAQSDPTVPPLAALKLAALNAVKILDSPRPGQTMRIQASVSGRLGGLVQAVAQIHVADRLVMTATLTLSGQERPRGFTESPAST